MFFLFCEGREGEDEDEDGASAERSSSGSNVADIPSASITRGTDVGSVILSVVDAMALAFSATSRREKARERRDDDDNDDGGEGLRRWGGRGREGRGSRTKLCPFLFRLAPFSKSLRVILH